MNGNDISSPAVIVIPNYGIWIKNKGWLRGKEPLAFDHKDMAIEVARIVGGEVRYIDASLIDIEQTILTIEKERKSLWDTFRNLFKHRTNT